MSGNTAQEAGTWYIERRVGELQPEPILVPGPIRARNFARRWLLQLGCKVIDIVIPGNFRPDHWVVVITATWVAAPFVQNIASQAATSTYRAFSRVIESISSGRHDIEGKWDVLILRTEDGQLSVEIPGNLPEGAHSALVRDFDNLVAGGRDGKVIRIWWDEESEKWVTACR